MAEAIKREAKLVAVVVSVDGIMQTIAADQVHFHSHEWEWDFGTTGYIKLKLDGEQFRDVEDIEIDAW